MWIEEIRKLMFRALALRRSESRNCGLCVVYIQTYRLQMQLAQPKTIFEFCLPSIIAYSQRNMTVPRPVRSYGRFLQDSYIFSCLSRPLKPWLAVRQRTACFPTHFTLIAFKYETPHTEVVCAHQASMCGALEARGRHFFPLFPPFCSAKLWKHYIYVCMTNMGNVQTSG